MIPQTTSAVFTIAVFLLPGFIGQRYAEQTYAMRDEGAGIRGLALTLYYSLLSYIVLVAIAVLCGIDRAGFESWLSGDREPKSYLTATLGLIAISLLIAESGRQWRRLQRFRSRMLGKLGIDERHTVVSGWDWFFNSGQDCLVIVTLKNGEQIAGYLGRTSYAGYTQDTQDLFLQERWVLDDKGWIKEKAHGTLGVYISADQIGNLDFYDFAPTDGTPPEADDQPVHSTEEHQ